MAALRRRAPRPKGVAGTPLATGSGEPNLEQCGTDDREADEIPILESIPCACSSDRRMNGGSALGSPVYCPNNTRYPLHSGL